MEQQYYLVDGTAYEGQVFESEKGFSFGEADVPCPVCRGGGRNRRGGACPRCGGQRTIFDQIKIHTADELKKLQKAQDKRKNAKQNAEIARQAAILESHEDYVATHPVLFARAAAEKGNAFLQDLVAKSKQYGGLTDAQTAAMERSIAGMDAERSRYASSRAIGSVGDRIDREFDCVAVRTIQRPNYMRTAIEDVFVHEMRDDDGNAVVVVSRKTLFDATARVRIEGEITGIDTSRGYSRTLVGSVKSTVLDASAGMMP